MPHTEIIKKPLEAFDAFLRKGDLEHCIKFWHNGFGPKNVTLKELIFLLEKRIKEAKDIRDINWVKFLVHWEKKLTPFAIFFAFKYEKPEVSAMLFKPLSQHGLGLHINSGFEKKTALELAIDHLDVKTVSELLNAGAFVLQRNADGNTPLFFAVTYYLSLYKDIIVADHPDYKETREKSLKLIQEKMSCLKKIIQSLLEHGANIYSPSFGEDPTALEAVKVHFLHTINQFIQPREKEIPQEKKQVISLLIKDFMSPKNEDIKIISRQANALRVMVINGLNEFKDEPGYLHFVNALTYQFKFLSFLASHSHHAEHQRSIVHQGSFCSHLWAAQTPKILPKIDHQRGERGVENYLSPNIRC